MSTETLYEKPRLVRHRPGLLNKFGALPACQACTEIDGVPVADLAARHGSPLFVFSERTIVSRTREMLEAFRRRWPRVQLAWSYKTNYLEAICRIFHREGSWAEVVSGFEYEKALATGVPGERIIFNGPYKDEPALLEAARRGSQVNLDNLDELARAEAVARRLGRRLPVGLRLNLATSATPPWGRFGFNLENGQARDAVRRLLAGGLLELRGLHCHLGTFIQAPAAYREQAGKLAAFAEELRRSEGILLDYLDLGGGIASRNTLHGQYLPGSQNTPAFSRYAEAVVEGLAELDYPADRLPLLILENGRALVDEAGTLVTTVVASKRLPDGTRSVVVDAGVNLLFTAFWYRHDVVPAQEPTGAPEQAVLHGPLCMNIDVLRPSLQLPPLEVGDRLLVRQVGAYNVTQWMQFITYRPAVVLIGEQGEDAIVRRAEDLAAVTALEEVPSWLRDR